VPRLQIRPIVHNKGAASTMPPSYIRVRAVLWPYGRGQTDTQTRVTTIHFASSTTHAKRNYTLRMFYQTQTARRSPKGPKNAVFVPGDLHLWPWPSDSSERGTKHVFHVNLVQIRSAVHMFHSQTKTTDWRRQKQNLPQFSACGNNCTKPITNN